MDIVESKVLEPIEQMIEGLGVGSVYGEPFKEGDTTVIPVASVGYGFGYGYGEGTSEGEEASEESEGPSTGSGGGGGGGGMAKPQGYLRITADEVTYEPIVDQSKIALAGMFMSAWSVFWKS